MLNRNLVGKSHKSIFPFVGNMVTLLRILDSSRKMLCI
jgi:hypothetical protein